MFNLEQSIAAWRQQMLAAGIQSPVPLEELENHLRDEIERRLCVGFTAQVAFDFAVQQVGTPGLLKNEFSKADEVKALREMKQVQIILFSGLGMISLFITACLVFKLGSFSETSPSQQLSGLIADAVLIGLAGGGYWGCKIFPVISDKKLRGVICISCGVLLAAWWTLFFFVILPRAEFTIGQLDVAILWGFAAPFGALAGIVTGLAKAASKKSELGDLLSA